MRTIVNSAITQDDLALAICIVQRTDESDLYYEGDALPGLPPPTPEQLAAALIPQSVSPRQFRQALNAVGMRAPIEAVVAAGDQNLKDWWEFASSFERQNPLLLTMAASMSIPAAQIDQVFTLAGSL